MSDALPDSDMTSLLYILSSEIRLLVLSSAFELEKVLDSSYREVSTWCHGW